MSRKNISFAQYITNRHPAKVMIALTTISTIDIVFRLSIASSEKSEKSIN